MLQKGSLANTIFNFVMAALLLTAGILTCAFAGNAQFQSVIIMIVGILVIIEAAFQLLFQVINVFRAGKDTTIVKTNLGAAITGASGLAIGIILVFMAISLNPEAEGYNPDYAAVVFQYVGLFAGILLVAVGAVLLIEGTVFMVKKAQSVPASIGMLVLSAVLITAGILTIVFLTDRANALLTFFIILGILLILAAVALIVGTILGLVANKKGGEAVIEEKVEEAVSEDKAE